MKDLIIAIDGPSGVGKSTLSKLLARELGYLNLDTGAMYRTVALAACRQQVAADDAEALGDLCGNLRIEFLPGEERERVLLNGEDVTHAIRTPEISQLTPRVAAVPAVRAAMVAQQRRLGAGGGVVLEGRDIGTVVFPDADLKIFLQASAAVRGRRRFLELQAAGVDVDLQETITAVAARDASDSQRAVSPLRQAADAVVVDTSNLEIPEVLAKILELVRLRTSGIGPQAEG